MSGFQRAISMASWADCLILPGALAREPPVVRVVQRTYDGHCAVRGVRDSWDPQRSTVRVEVTYSGHSRRTTWWLRCGATSVPIQTRKPTLAAVTARLMSRIKFNSLCSMLLKAA